MTILHLSLALAIIAVSHFAGRWDGTEEAEKINAQRKINHAWELTFRVVFFLLGMVYMYHAHDWFGTPQWKLFCVTGMAFGAFVPTHRYYVNTRRTTPKREWWYIAPLGNNYDKLWFGVRMAWKYRKWPTYREMVACLALCEANKSLDWAKRQTARIMYGFEAFVLILSTTTYVLA